MKLAIALCLALAALPLRANEIPDWFAETFLDVREDVAEAAKEGRRVMLYFWLDGCPYCKQMETVTFRNPAVVARMKRELVSVAINVRGDREATWTDGARMSEKALTAFLKVRGTPTLVFLDEKGVVTQRVSGYLDPTQFSAVLDRAGAARSASPPGPQVPTSPAPQAPRPSRG